jgi:hypothetical protein
VEPALAKKTNTKLYFLFLVIKVEASYKVHQVADTKKGMTEQEYQQELHQRGAQWDKHLEEKRNKNISKESQIGKF